GLGTLLDSEEKVPKRLLSQLRYSLGSAITPCGFICRSQRGQNKRSAVAGVNFASLVFLLATQQSKITCFAFVGSVGSPGVG
ncbi:MAG: hypothetical protein LIO68_08275, partial [Rikenellaceae bacterium]|nr:hypothetical protein [Rikenellaceae bacterium]